MKELYYFKDPGNPHITVALAGISKFDWTSVSSDMNKYDVSTIMSTNRFDILPIVNGANVTHCFKTIRWGNYSPENIEKHEIRDQERLYYLTNIEDAIHLFARSGNKFFFLDNLKDIIGLTTIGNLNCKHVYLHLYNLIIQLENLLGSFIYLKGITDQRLLKAFEIGIESKHEKDIVRRYRRDDSMGMDSRFIDYVFFSDYIQIYKHYDLAKELDISFDCLEGYITKINDLRNMVAHPNQSLIKKDSSIFILSEAIQLIYQLLDKLKEKTKI